MYYLGIDIGSLSCDAVLIDGGSDIVASTVIPTGARNR
jgi:activator of 2-hydroxyglutaryl-CoA dehydratase